MPTKIVNLNGTLNLQDDEFDIGLNGFTELINLRQENGKLVRRLGTGALVTHTSKEITGMEMFVHRKMSGVRVRDTNTNNIVFDHSEKTMTIGGTMNTTNINAPGGDATDLRSIFKSGDTVYLFYSGTSANDAQLFNISSVSATALTFNRGFDSDSDETLNTGGAHFIISFALADYDDTVPTYINIFDGDSYDGRAFLTTYNTTTNTLIALISPTAFQTDDVIPLEDFGSGTNDMHIRVNAYADAVRFACGLEHKPRIFRYVNRHFFNGLFKDVWNANADLLYPRWVIDSAVPSRTGNAYDRASIKVDDVIVSNPDGITDRSVKLIDGALNVKDDVYNYKFVPVYDGTQEDILDNAVAEYSTGATFKKRVEKSGILSKERSCALMNLRIDLQTLNPRSSALNVYRSTNGGTYYKIKSIYMGDDDPTQKTAVGRVARDLFWFSGGLLQSGASNGAHTSLNSQILMVDGFWFDIDTGTGYSDYEGTGFQCFQTGSASATGKQYFDAIEVSPDSRMGYQYYGAYDISKFNHPSVATDTIFANNGEAIGGSPNGGWYIAASTEYMAAVSGASVTDTDGTIVESGDGGVEGPFGYDYSSTDTSSAFEIQVKQTATGAGPAMGYYDLITGTNLTSSNKYIVSGWICAEGFDHPEVSWSCFLSSSTGLTEGTETGDLLIAQGEGGDLNQNIDKWRYFQYELTATGVELYLYFYINHADQAGVAAKNIIRVKALSVRSPVTGYELSDGMVGFGGKNVIVGSEITDLNAPDGALKGNRISNDDTAYPTDSEYDFTYIADNVGPFIKTAGIAPPDSSSGDGGVGDSSGGSGTSSTYSISTSNYQFVAKTNNLNQYVNLDFFDPGLPDGARHPYEGSTSLNVKYKYSTMLNGRQFVANVRIASDGETEEYPNFVMFSGANAPDIIPISNFIQLQDLQGGEIVGIETLMSDIVVFMTNGIFRLNVPSDNPANWSLVEAHPNIGAIHDRGITKAPNGIYFCGRSDVFFLDSGFQASPITGPIRDIYQIKSATTSDEKNLNLFYDAKYNRLYMNYTRGASSSMYVFDIARGIWYQDSYRNYTYGVSHLTKDNENKTIFIDRGTHSSIQYAEGSTYNDLDSSSYPVLITMKTGKQIFSTLDKKSMIRRVNTILTKSDSSGKDLDLDIITDQGTIEKNSYLDGTQSTRIANRGKFVQIEINNDGDSADSYEYEINHVDVEYE